MKGPRMVAQTVGPGAGGELDGDHEVDRAGGGSRGDPDGLGRRVARLDQPKGKVPRPRKHLKGEHHNHKRYRKTTTVVMSQQQ